MVITCKNISKSFITDIVLSNVNFQLEAGEKAAIVGINGAGKTTLFRVITKELEPDSGQVIIPNNLRLGYLSQHSSLSSTKSIFQEMLTTKQELIDIEKKLREYESKMSSLDPESEAFTNILKSYSDLQHTYEERDGYAYRSYIIGILKGLGFDESEFDKQIVNLSGGQKTRVALAKILLEEPDILLLDEPTNHLDIKATSWLESFLSNYSKTLLIISHDRYFLDKVVDKVIEIENTKSHTYSGNYSFYIKHKNINREIELKHYQNQQKEIKKQEEVIRQLRSFNREKSIKRAKSREKNLEKIERIDKPITLNDSMHLRLEPKIMSGTDVCIAKDLSKSFGDNHLFRAIHFHIQRGEKVALIGDNGTGKTTLFNIINQKLQADTGTIKLGTKVKLGYYDQEHASLSGHKNLIEEISDTYPTMKIGAIRNVLGAFLFTGDDVFKKISSLSGGEKGRLTLAKLMLSESNFLLLDEPTNHLDIISKEILEKTLNQYTGTVLFISHDRYFINKVATRVIELTQDKFINYLGNYDYYLEKKLEKEKELEKTGTIQETKPISSSKDDWRKNKEDEANRRRLDNQIKKIEEDIHTLEENIEAIDEQLVQEHVYTNHELANDLHQEKIALEEKLSEAYDLWDFLLDEKTE